jgi:hypothetical protein
MTYQAVVSGLQAGPAILTSLIRGVPEDLLKRRPAEGKWSPHEHFCHLPDIEPMVQQRLDAMMGEDNPVIAPYDPARDESDGYLLHRDLDEAVDDFYYRRGKLVARVSGFADSDWERMGIHAEYVEYSVFILLRHIVLHDGFHGARMEDAYVDQDWVARKK